MENLKLRKRIKEMFKSQIAFAYHLKEDDSLVSKVVCGWKTLDDEKQDRWARALRTPKEDLFD